jgi:predicted protein tyrosine phosphatase
MFVSFESKTNITLMFQIIFHSLQIFEMNIKHNGEHILNLMWIVNFQKLQERFDHLNNLHVILKDVDFKIKGMKSIYSLSHLNFQSQCQIDRCSENIR